MELAHLSKHNFQYRRILEYWLYDRCYLRSSYKRVVVELVPYSVTVVRCTINSDCFKWKL